MSKFLKGLSIAAFVIVILAVVGISATIGWRPFIGPKKRALTDRKFEATPERLKRGAYLAEHVAGIGNFTGDQRARAIREGISHDGQTLFPMTPYAHYRRMSDEDLASVIVYIRSLPPLRNPLPRTDIHFPVKYLFRGVPEPVTETVQPDFSTPVNRGEYLVNLSVCSECHTPQKQGRPDSTMKFGGGQFLDDAGKTVSPNITPDATGIRNYTEDILAKAMRTG